MRERVLAVPGTKPEVRALEATAVTQPTQGVLTYAERSVDREVCIFIPVVPVAVAITASLATRVSPEHVTVTVPASRTEVTVSVIVSVVYAEVEVTEAGELIAHKLIAACAVTRPAGKVSVILLFDACAANAVEVLKVTVAVLSVPVPMSIFNAFNSAVTPPIMGVLI